MITHVHSTLRTTLLAAVLLMLASCGFQLRDNYQLPALMERLHVDAPTFSAFADTLRERLELAGVQLTPNSDERLTIRIVDDELDRRALSLSSSGQVAEYELIYRVRYQVILPDRDPEDFELEVYRDYQDDPNFALAKTREREILVEEMRVDASRLMVRRLVNQITQDTSAKAE